MGALLGASRASREHVAPLARARACASRRQRYKKAPSFFSLHLGVDAGVFAARDGREAEHDCHHIILEDWTKCAPPLT